MDILLKAIKITFWGIAGLIIFALLVNPERVTTNPRVTLSPEVTDNNNINTLPSKSRHLYKPKYDYTESNQRKFDYMMEQIQ